MGPEPNRSIPVWSVTSWAELLAASKFQPRTVPIGRPRALGTAASVTSTVWAGISDCHAGFETSVVVVVTRCTVPTPLDLTYQTLCLPPDRSLSNAICFASGEYEGNPSNPD